jgi:acyl-coenzyme A thioesterase PaaI-like protein
MSITITAVAPNRLQRSLERLSEAPGFMQRWVRNIVLHRAVPFTGTAKVNFVHMSPERVEVHLANDRAVQNHIGSVHASAMNLLAETASGMVVGMNVRDDCLPLAKSAHHGLPQTRPPALLKAVATLSALQQQALHSTDKGEVNVRVIVTDETGIEPVECEFVWAWVPARPRQS